MITQSESEFSFLPVCINNSSVCCLCVYRKSNIRQTRKQTTEEEAVGTGECLLTCLSLVCLCHRVFACFCLSDGFRGWRPSLNHSSAGSIIDGVIS